jgi:Anti-sigma factor NepR
MVDDGKERLKAGMSGKKSESMKPTAGKPDVSDLIGQRLRVYYEEVAKEPVPDRFLDLLSQLEAASDEKKPG